MGTFKRLPMPYLEEFTAAPPNRFTSPLPGCELPAIDLDATCGLNNRTWGFCRTTNSSCAFAKGAQSGSRTCQCVHGNIAIVDIVSGKRTCKEAPTELFSTYYQRTVQSSLTKLSPVLNISLNTGNIAMDPVSFKITLHPSDSFLAIPNTDSSTFSVITISDLPQEEKSYQFFLEAEMTYGDVIVKDITSLTINVTRVFPTPPPIAGIFVLDGTRKGSIVYDISADLGSVDGLDLSLVANPPTTVFKLDKNRIVCTEDVQLVRLQNSQDSIGQLVNLSITSRTQVVVITIQAVILVNRRYIEIQENSLLSMKVADFSSLVNSYDISLRPPYDDNVFGISASQSYVQLLRNLDFENWNRRNYIFRLSIVSKHNLQIKTEVETEVAVVDVNDIPPQFDRSTYFFTVPAGSPAGTIIGILRVTDRDTEPVIYTYVIDNSNYSSIFKVESGTGAITASQDIQNMNSSIVFNVTVSDGVNLSRKPALVIITVSKIQPEMVRLGKSLEADVVEGQDIGMFVINASVANYTGYQLLPDVIKYNFTINSTTGVVTTVSPIDREGELEINVFSVIAYHIEEACSFKIVGNVSITVKDINDNSPVFSDGGVYSVRLQEHASRGTSVFTVTAMDRDEGENSTLNFNLTGADSHLFTINTQTGTISVTNSANLDREQKTTLQVTVIAEDGGSTLAPSARLSTNASLSLILEDVNDNSPEFKNSIYNFTVNENEPAGTSVGNVTATDRDINENADIRYVLRGDGSWGFFRMNVTTGLLQTTQPIDREQYDNFTLTILAIDNGNPERTSSCLVAVKVMDRNDVTPLFKNIDNPRIIEEGSACATVPFLQVQAVDTDAGLNGQIYYTIDSNALLNIDNVTGNVTCQAKGLDYENETHRDISVTVQAHDMGSEQQLMGMANIRVLLNDINDNQPEFLKSPYYISIPSATFRYVNSTVYVVMFQDRDSGANGEVDLTLNATSSLGENLLWIDDRGVIRVKRDIYGTESGKELVYEVVATDRGQSRLSNRTNFTLIVDASNATDEKIIDPDISISVEERSCPPSGAVVGRLSVDLQYTATFYLFNTDDTFTVNSTTGELLCHADLDRETKERHQLFVNVTAGNHHTYTVVVVTVTDVNDNAPKFELMQHRLVTQVEESASNGYFIITVSALDNDAGDNGTIVYSILEPKEPFAINATHGGIFVQTSLNRESVSQYSLTILAKDKGPQPLNSTTTVEITILDVNDNAPTFNSNLSREFFVPENVDSLFEVGRMEATDPDYGLNGRVTYSITNVGQCPFIMHDEGAIGIIKLGDSKTLDFERSRDYTCTIQASDLGDPRLNTTLDVTIIVTDVNDNAPVFHDVKQSVNVSRDANTSYVIVPMLNVTDEDTGKNAEVAFSFVSVENSSTSTERDVLNYFDLDAVSGKIGIRKSLRDLPRDAINLTVQAQDQGDPILSAVVQIEVVITDNNTAPQFNQSVYKYVLTEEDKGFVGTLLTVSAFDYENHVHVPECNCTYSIISVEAEKDFNATFLAIDNKTGAVTLQQAIDREESGGIINVILQATDHGLPPKSDQAMLEITVSDINDNAPQFEQLLYQTIITKSHCERGQPFFKVKARDSDSPPNDNTTYILAEKTFQGIEINRTTGELILTESVCPQRYHNEKYTAIVIAYDGYWNSSSTNIFITVNHSDSNLHEPVFASPKYVTSLSSTAKVGTTLQLVNFYANDSDGDVINYNITSGNIVCPKSVFSIDSVTGVITVESEIEYLNIPYYNLTVTAVDTGDFNSYFRRTGTTVVEINVPDLTKTCYKPAEVEQLSSEAEQFQLFRGLFIGLAILLGIVVVLGVAFFYKWRVAKSDTQQNNSEIRFEMDPTGEQKGSAKVSSVDTRGTPPRLPPREQGYSGMESGLNNGAVDSEGYLSPSEPSQSGGEQQLTSADSQQFPQRTGRMANTTGYLPLSASDPTRFAEQTPEKSLNRSKYLTPSHMTSSRDQESTAYLHPLPRPSLSYNTHVQATVDPDDVKPSFSPLAAHGNHQQNEHQFQPSFASQSLADGRRLVSTMQPELGQSSRDAFRSEAEVRRDPRGIRPTRNLRGDDSNNDGGYRPMLFKLDRNAQ